MEKSFEKFEPCPSSSPISTSLAENREKVANYPLGDSAEYLPGLGLKYLHNVTEFFGSPVIVTAASSDYFSYAMGLIKRLTTSMTPKLKIVVFDIGMSQQERLKICENDVCKLRKLHFSQYPVFIEEDISTTAWKPLVIQIALQEFGFIIWMDSAVYLHDGDLQAGIDIARRYRIAAGHKRVTFTDINLAFETDIQTFRALGEKPCAFQNSFRFNAALLFIRRCGFTYKYIMRPWVSCALTKSCIVTYRASNLKCVGANNYGHCHRFDQSVLSIILNRLYSSNITYIDLQDKVKWTKCYSRDSVTIYNEMLFDSRSGDLIQCPKEDAMH